MMRGLDVAFLGSGILQLFAVDATGTEEETKQAIEPIATSNRCMGTSATANSSHSNWTEVSLAKHLETNLTSLSTNETIIVPLCDELNCTVPGQEQNRMLNRRSRPGEPYLRARSRIEDSLFDPNFSHNYFWNVSMWFARVTGGFTVRRRITLYQYLNLEYEGLDHVDPHKIWSVDYCLDPGILRDWAADIMHSRDFTVGTSEDRCHFYASVMGADPPEQLVKVLNDPHANGRGCDLRLKHLKYLSLARCLLTLLPVLKVGFPNNDSDPTTVTELLALKAYMVDGRSSAETVAEKLGIILQNQYPDSAIGLAFETYAKRMYRNALKNVEGQLANRMGEVARVDWSHNTCLWSVVSSVLFAGGLCLALAIRRTVGKYGEERRADDRFFVENEESCEDKPIRDYKDRAENSGWLRR